MNKDRYTSLFLSASPIGKYNIYQVHFYGDLHELYLRECNRPGSIPLYSLQDLLRKSPNLWDLLKW